MSDWYIGQKVVAVRSFLKAAADRPGLKVPTLGGIYTIRDMHFAPETVAFLFEELDNRELRCSCGEPLPFELPFMSRNFRPLVNQSGDISELTAILDKVSSGDMVDA